ncbi:MAG: hypothetical protein ACTSWG_10510 [Candidatus Helarchaeota archaeon]
MYEPLTESEIEFLGHFYDPISMTENLIPVNENAPQIWDDKCDCITLYPFQFAMQNYSYLIADDPNLEPEENFAKRKGAGDLFSIGARNLGKSFMIKIDVLLAYIHKFKEACVASFDQKHVSKVTDIIASYLMNHPFAKIFHIRKGNSDGVSRKHGGLRAITEHGCLIESANEKIESNNPGVDFHSKHYEILWYEEFSYASEEGTKKRVDSGSQLGYIERFSGIPDLRIGSPMTKILNNEKIKNWIWRQPQYVHPLWNEKMMEKRIAEYNGKNSSAYKLNVEAEIIEGAEGFWDIERLKKKCLKKDKRIKYFEISKDTFYKFKNLIIVDRLPGTEKVFIDADIGLGGAPTEIIIIFKVNEKYKYTYNISLFKLIQKEQAKIFKWLYDILGGAFISCDATGDNGVIIDELYEMGIPQDYLMKVKFNKNIEVDFEKDENGNVKRDKNGNPLMKKVPTMDWAMSELENLIYSGLLEIPIDQKLLTEFNGFFVKQSGMRKIYGSSTHDHLHQSFQCFAINRYFNEFNNLDNLSTENQCWGIL